MAQDGFEQVEPGGEQRGAGEQDQEDGDAPAHAHLVDHHGAERQEQAPCVDEQHRLTLVVALTYETVVDVARVRLADAHMGALATDDRRERVEDGHAGHDERDDEGGERGGAAHVEK